MAPIDAEDFDYDLFDFPRLDTLTRKKANRTVPRSLLEYKEHVRRRLAEGDIAEHLLDHWYHADFYRALPSTVAWWYRLFQPRSIEELSIHVCRHLSWYLNRTKTYSNARVFLIPVATISFSIMIAAYFFLPLIAPASSAVELFHMLIFILLVLYGLGYLLGRVGVVPLARTLIHKAEFYLYMRDKLRDFEPKKRS
jgi:hypothetical protein